jgi:hypothetical protein
VKTLHALILWNIAFLPYANAEWTEEDRRIEAEQVTLWENKVSEAKQKPPARRPAELWLGLRNMGCRRTFDSHSPAVELIYGKLQAELVSIPGHARYFADSIESERKKVEDVRFNLGPRIDYDLNRRLAFETLAHLPSPETIKVLGDYLSDERDLHEMTPEETKGESCISGGSTGNSTYSTKALEQSALRDKPYREGTVYDFKVAKAAWRTWWEEIKSGKRTFSFVDQKVEYRFKADGTWETIALVNPPNDGPKPPKAESVDRKNPAESPEANGISAHNYSWAWIVGGAIYLLAIVIWLRVKRR